MNRPLNVIYMIDKLDSDLAGTENQLIKLINGLTKRGFKIHLICLSNHPWFQENAPYLDCTSSVIEINRFTNPRAYLNFLKLIDFIKKNKPDIVHTFFPVANIVGVIAARIAGIKNILSSRRDYGEWMSARYLLATKIANRYVQSVVTNSNQVKELTEKKEQVPENKIDVIYNGIDRDSFRIEEQDYLLKKSLNIPETHKVVGIVANFRPMKHHATFIKAAREILRVTDEVSFLLVGEGGDLKQEMEQLSNQLQISDHVHFTGPQKKIVHFLSIMDIGVNCSEKEGLSNAIMEYMAAGVPCVASNAGGNPDLIQHGENGYLFDLDDYKSLASLILKLLQDQETRAKFIRTSAEKIQKEMSLDAMLSNYKSLYQRKINV